MIDEVYHLKDDGNSTIDLEFRLRLTTPNVDPASYWNKSSVAEPAAPAQPAATAAEQETRHVPPAMGRATDNFSLASSSEEEEEETTTSTESSTEATSKIEDKFDKFLRVLERNELSREEERKLMLSM